MLFIFTFCYLANEHKNMYVNESSKEMQVIFDILKKKEAHILASFLLMLLFYFKGACLIHGSRPRASVQQI